METSSRRNDGVKTKSAHDFTRSFPGRKMTIDLVENVIGCFRSRRNRHTRQSIVVGMLCSVTNGSIHRWRYPKPIMNRFLKKNAISDRSKYFWHKPIAQKRIRRTEYQPTARIDMAIGVFGRLRDVH